jgi:peptidoglycan/LPS O-acetylase OafA/YrhL
MAAPTSPGTGARTGRDDTSPTTDRERSLSILGGLLGLAMFALGFLRWLSVGEGDDQSKFSGFAYQMPTTAIIGLSLAAGIIALLGATERRRGRGVPSAIPTGLAITSLLLAIGVYLGKGAISPELGDEVGVEIGLTLAILVAAVQSLVLGLGLASRHDDGDYDVRVRR